MRRAQPWSDWWAPSQPWAVRRAELQALFSRRNARLVLVVGIFHALPFLSDASAGLRGGELLALVLFDFGLVKFADFSAVRHTSVDALVASDAWQAALRHTGLSVAPPIDGVPAELRAPTEALPRTVGTWRVELLERNVEFTVYSSVVGPAYVMSGVLMDVGGDAEPSDFEWCPAGPWHDLAHPTDAEVDAWRVLASEGAAFRREGRWLAAAVPEVAPSLIRPLLLALHDCALQLRH